MPKVYNKHHKNAPADAIYVGRPTKWGNPFEIGVHGDRGTVIHMYKNLVNELPGRIAEIKSELAGKDLVCWCAPKPCHADILLEIANASD